MRKPLIPHGVKEPIKPPLVRLYALRRDCANLCLADGNAEAC